VPLSVVLGVHQFLPEFVAGTEILTYETARELRRRGHDVTVLTGFSRRDGLGAAGSDCYVLEGIPVRRFFEQPKRPVDYDNAPFAAELKAYLQARAPDVVHFFHFGRLSASAIDVGDELNLPMVFTPTDFWLLCPLTHLRLPDGTPCSGPDSYSMNCVRHFASRMMPRLRPVFSRTPDRLLAGAIRRIERGALSRFWFSPYVSALARRPSFLRERVGKLDRLIVPTRLVDRLLRQNGFPMDRATLVPYGINVDGIRREARRDGGRRLKVGFIGTLYEHKGADVLIRAVRVLSRDCSLHLRVYGRTDEFPDYSRRLRRLADGDERIEFCGTFPPARLGDTIASLDVLVVPSVWYENTPLVAYSAQAAACPIVASNVPGLAEVVQHNENGLLFEPGDSRGLAAALEQLVRQPGLLSRLSSRAPLPRPIGDYVTSLIDIYGAVMRERGRRR
jgi:glycosyltransferase involved in cell wall biosynthesis